VVGYWRNRSGVLCVPLADTYTVAGAYHTPQQKLRPGGRVLLSGDSLCTYQQLEHIRPAAAAGAIAVAYFAFRWLIRTRSLERITRPPGVAGMPP
jgi:hypothetical protein